MHNFGFIEILNNVFHRMPHGHFDGLIEEYLRAILCADIDTVSNALTINGPQKSS